MKKKLFITGGGGMLATAAEQYFSGNGWEVLAPSRKQLDITDLSAVEAAIIAAKPGIVLHAAAMHVDPCEDDPEKAYKVNAWATCNIARVSEKAGSNLVYISSCGYFGDEKKFYSEYDPVVLKTVYARSKHAGEVCALNECSRAFAVRPGWLFGGSIRHAKNFAYQRYLEAQKSSVLRSAGDKYGSPTFVGDLVKKIDEIVAAGMPGLYHVTNGGGGSRADYVKAILESCGLKTAVEHVDSGSFPRKANVPDCEMLHNWNLKYAGLPPMPSWQDAVGRYCSDMLKEIKN